MQTGVQDAVNLGWKLAAVVRGTAPDGLLDSYHAERHPVAAAILRRCLASVVLRRDDERTRAVRDTIVELLAFDDARTSLAATMSGLDIHYDLGGGHPLLGRRMPDLDLTTAAGPTHVYALLHEAKPLLLNFMAAGALDIDGGAGRVKLVDAACDGPWSLPVLGPVTAPGAVLVRPDGYVAWVGDGTHNGLAEALQRWFGPPAR